MGDAINWLALHTMFLNSIVGAGLYVIALRTEQSAPKPTDRPGGFDRKSTWRTIKWLALVMAVGSFVIGVVQLIWPNGITPAT